MFTNEKYQSNFIGSQIPAFVNNENPEFAEFLIKYYQWLESDDEILNKTRLLTETYDIDFTDNNSIIKLFKQFAENIPQYIKADPRLFLKHVNEIYKSKGSEKSIQLLIKALYNVDSEIYYPSTDVLRLSDGSWNFTNYLEIISPPNINDYIGRYIRGSISGAKAIVEDYYQENVNGSVVDIIKLTKLIGDFESFETFQLDDLSSNTYGIIIGSLSDISITDGGANFNVGDVLDVVGAGSRGKAKVISTKTQTGRVNFSLVDGGTGYSTNAVVQVFPKLIFNDVSKIDNIQVDQLAYQISNTGAMVANGTIMSTNSTSISIRLATPGFAQDKLTYTALQMKVQPYLNTFANGEVVFQSNTGLLVDATARGNILMVQPNTGNTSYYVSNVTGTFNVSNTVSGSNTFVLQGNTSGAVGYVFDILGGSNTGSFTYQDVDGGGVGAGFAVGDVFDKEIITLNTDYLRDYLNTKLLVFNESFAQTGTVSVTSGNNRITGVGTTFTSTLAANVYVQVSNSTTKQIRKVLSVTNNTLVICDSNFSNTQSSVPYYVEQTNYNFPKVSSLLDKETLETVLSTALTNVEKEIGTIKFLSKINPGIGYSTSPYVTVVEPLIASLGILDENGKLSGNNAVVTAESGNYGGIASVVQVIDSGVGYQPNQLVSLVKSNSSFAVTGISNIRKQGKTAGKWDNTNGFISSNKYIQDSDYYQDFSYEIRSRTNLDANVVINTVHPIGTKLFKKFQIESHINDKPLLVESSITLGLPIVDFTFDYNTPFPSDLQFTRASNAWFFDTNYNLQQANVNIPRIARDPESGISGWLLEPARTNTIRNPSCLGANLITGEPPTNWLYANGTGSNLSFITTGIGTENNIPYVDVRLFGRPTSNVSPLIRADQVYSSAAYTQLWTHSLYLKLVGGSLNGIDTPRLTISEWAANGSFLQQQSSIITIPEATARFSNSKKIASVALANTSTATVGSQFSVLCYENQDIDATFRIGAPQLERGTGATNPLQTFDTSPILNLTSTSSTITRASENVSMPLNIGSEFTIFCEYMYTRHIPGVGGTTLIQVRLDDSTTNNMLQLLSRSVGVPVVRGALTGDGVGVGTPDQLYTLGTIAKQAITYSSGTAFYSYNGISPLMLTGTFTKPLNRLLVAANAPSYVRRITVWGRRMSNTELQSLTTL